MRIFPFSKYGLLSAYLSLVAFLAANGCRLRQSGISISTDLTVPVYIKVNALANGDKVGYFPQLDVFDQDGFLVYSGHDVTENSHLLNTLPEGLQSLHRQPHAATLSRILDEMPALRTSKAKLLGRHSINILSVSLDGCHGCSIQEDALVRSETRLLSSGVNLLVIRVARP